jgi:maltooligosyltrehalose trehalohydrolase
MPLIGSQRRVSCGVEVQRDGAHARVWAPACGRIDFVHERGGTRTVLPLEREGDGFFAGHVDAVAGDKYWFRLDGDRLRPDPCSRFQPEGPHGPSQIVDPTTFTWTDDDWRGVTTSHGHVLYELHVGTFTPQGTWAAAQAQVPELARLGISIIEVMPVAEFSGQFGWGYDGVNHYAPSHLYGAPDDLRAFVDAAHAAGLAVILDVVYNHLGPDGNYLRDFSPDYFTDKYDNDWGDAINFEGPAPARAFFVENAAYWIREFHFDGLRIDATQDVKDASEPHVLREMTAQARHAAGRRTLYVIGENEPQESWLVRPPSEGGYGLDALWNDDFHHTAMVALTGRREAYYRDYKGTPQEFISGAKYGFLYQGQWYGWQKKRRGTSAADLPPTSFVTFLQNHDQVANSGSGRRAHELASPARYRALTALLLLGPQTPLLFQGQEFLASTPFLYFADLPEHLRKPVADGRREFLSQFPSLRDPQVVPCLAPPDDPKTFARCKLDLTERERHAGGYALHRDLIALRRQDGVINGEARVAIDGAVLSSEAFILRFFGGAGDRLLVINLGCDLDLDPCPEPLLAPPAGAHWRLAWSSESPRYGGNGTPRASGDGRWPILAESAILYVSEPVHDDDERDGHTND